MLFNEYPTKTKHTQYIQTQLTLLNNISAMIKSTQSSILRSSSSANQQQNREKVSSSLLHLNNTLNEYLTQLVKENKRLEDKVYHHHLIINDIVRFIIESL